MILNGILVVAVGILYYLHFARPNGSQDSHNSTALANSPDAAARLAASQDAARRIVYVNTDSLTKKYAYYQQATKEMEEKQGKLDTELGGRFRALQNEAVALQQKASTLTQEQGQQAEQQLVRKQQDLEQYRARLGQQFLEDQRKKNEEIYETIAQHLRKRNQGSRYDYVLGYTKGANVLFANDSLDITKQVIEELNKQYREVNTVKKN